MKKFLIFSVFFLFTFFFLLKNNALAFSCSITPSSITENLKNPSFKIDSSGNLGSGKYDVYIYDSSHTNCIFISGNCTFVQKGVSASGGIITTSSSSQRGPSAGNPLTVAVFKAGTTDSANTCNKMTVSVNAGNTGSGGNNCTALNINSDNLNDRSDPTSIMFTPNNKITIQANFPTGASGQRRVQVRSNDGNGTVLWDQCAQVENNQISAQIGSFSSGNYYVQVNQQCNLLNILESMACNGGFNIDPSGGSNTAQSLSEVGPAPICKNSQDGKCLLIKTGLGDFGTDVSSIIKNLFSVVLGLAGGIAVIIIIISGFKLISSQGNPEKIQAAREQLVAAIVGLLFIIFSVFILQIIGVDILNIPGFGA